MNTAESRPVLSAALTSQEFRRWYWLKTELVDFAPTMSLRSTGSKQVLTARIAAALEIARIEVRVVGRVGCPSDGWSRLPG